MPSIRLPIVEGSTTLGQVAKVATKAEVGAALLRAGSGFSLVHVKELPAEPDWTAAVAADTMGRMLPRLSGVGGGTGVSFGIVAEHAGFADVQLADDHLATVNAPVGYKQCSVHAEHTYPPSYPESDCPRQDGGKLDLKYF